MRPIRGALAAARTADHRLDRVPGLTAGTPMLRRHVLRALAVMALLFVLVPASRMLLEALFYPWARSFGLWPVLVGSWRGEMHGPAGTTPVFIELRSRFMGSSDIRHIEPIGGRLRWCDGRAAIRDYAVRGDVQTWRGYRFRIVIDGDGGQTSSESPDDVVAEWRGDIIEGTGRLWRHGRTASAEATRGSAYSDGAPRVSYVLRRGEEDEFVAACSGARPTA